MKRAQKFLKMNAGQMQIRTADTRILSLRLLRFQMVPANIPKILNMK